MKLANIGMIGLAVMGENLTLNLESKGYRVAVYNRELDWIDRFLEGRGKGKNIVGCHSLEDLVKSIEKPRKIWMMIQAGSAVDQVLDALLPLLDPGDVIIDGGNSHYPDTTRRTKRVEAEGKLFIGTGVSGGEEGALKGPSLMPGGSSAAWPLVKDIFFAIAAKIDDGEACCDWVGENGAGHFVKMVHNGIEYGDMQLISEAYHLLKQGAGLSNDEMQKVFADWNTTELNSYLIEITSHILGHKDADGNYVVDLILDSAGQKGTGKWTVIEAANLGQPLTLIAEAVFARCLSSLKDERIAASKELRGPTAEFSGDKTALIEDLRLALYASKIISYAQGFALMRAASDDYHWNINYANVAKIWRGGCIIRSSFLGMIRKAFEQNASLPNLMLDPFFKDAIQHAQVSWRRVICTSVSLGIPLPAMSSALAYFDAYRHERLPANLLQAQRDYFGAHTYERIDRPRKEYFHTDWQETGSIASTTYEK